MQTPTQVQTTNTVRLRPDAPNWLVNASVLWQHRRTLLRITVLSLLASAPVVLLIPKQYESTARIMPPDNSSPGAAVLAALAGRSAGDFGGLGSLATSLLGIRTTGPLFVDLLRSSSVSGDLIDRFHLQRVYRKRYRVDAAKKLVRRMSAVEDKKSGVISITVEDSDPQRAKEMVQAYLDELNLLVNRTNTSSARQERLFIEHRLASAETELEQAQQEMSNFSSTHSTIDIKEQTRATIDAAAKLQAQLIVEQSELDSLRQVYGDENFRMRAARARVDELKMQLKAIGGTSEPLGVDGNIVSENQAGIDNTGQEHPPLRQLPRLAVPYADIYRRLRVRESVVELLTQQYELARIQEAKDVPAVRIIDAPGVPEKKSFPPRTLFSLLFTVAIALLASATILARHRWNELDDSDDGKMLGRQVIGTFNDLVARLQPATRRRSHA